MDVRDYKYSIHCAVDPSHRQLLGNSPTVDDFLNHAVAEGWTQIDGPDWRTAEGWELDQLVKFQCPLHALERCI